MINDYTEKELNVKDEKGRFVKGNAYKWTPGTSGNPNGRPKGSKNGAAALRRIASYYRDPKTGLTAEEQIGAKLISQALEGDLKAIEMFYNYTYGKPGVRIETPEELSFEELCEQHGISKDDALEEARRIYLLESASDPRGENADQKA